MGRVGLGVADLGDWKFFKCVEEAEFGPGPPINFAFVEAKLLDKNTILREHCKWMSIHTCREWLVNVKPGGVRVGLLAVIGLINESTEPTKFQVPSTLRFQEYPPGVVVIPMRSKTAKPFHTTNLVVFAPENDSGECKDGSFVASGDALIVDPGCRSESLEELREIVAALPRRLIVFATHHHRDHINGLSVIQKTNPDAILLAHKNTMSHIHKDDWNSAYTFVSGSEDICVGGQRLSIIFAPGHTDGHLALLHNSTRSLIVGDHCVGQGSAFLDLYSGASMADYFKTTYKFMELSPHALIPMHGRVSFWPKHMLCGYLKNRRSREKSILRAIERGAETLFEIVVKAYSRIDHSYWIPASWNVKLHVDHLALLDKLPKCFSIERFNRSLGSFAAELDKFEAKSSL
ncbi:endoribonuclease LACTB2-like isoform X2 [Punica granatum]|nr:endoribonuclease LACTB2-like isoform X2 [Punica granatum]